MNARTTAALALPLSLLLAAALAGCATHPAQDEGFLADAEEITRTEANGDTITEYRIAGQLRAVRVQPSRGPEYFLYDRDGDGSIDSNSGDDPPQTYFKLFEWD